ncbi:hypothetical protein, partial [Enterococcus faecium]
MKRNESERGKKRSKRDRGEREKEEETRRKKGKEKGFLRERETTYNPTFAFWGKVFPPTKKRLFTQT